MDRREFSQHLSLGALAAGAFVSSARAAISKTEKKQWAHEHLKGMENVVMPSFTPDFQSLDEEGIRHDVRQSIRHGFCSSTVSPTGANAAQRERLMEVVRDESKDKILTSVIVGGSAESAIASLAAAEKSGCTHAMVMYPGNLQPQSEDEVYAPFQKGRRLHIAGDPALRLRRSRVAALSSHRDSGQCIRPAGRRSECGRREAHAADERRHSV